MRCPNDQSNLILKTQEGTVAHICNQCDAVFLKAKYVAAFKYNFETDCLDKAFENSNTKSTEKPCANCDSLMDRVDIEYMPIEICKKCNSVLFQKGQLTRLKNTHSGMTDTNAALIGCLPASFVAIFSLFKYFSMDPNSKHRAAYGWLFIIAVFFSALFWLDFSSI